MGDESLDYMELREFYLSKRAEYPLLEQVIAGEVAFANKVAEVMLSLEKPTREITANLQTIVELSEATVDLENIPHYGVTRQGLEWVSVLFGGSTAVAGGAIALGLLFPPTAPLAVALGVLLGGSAVGFGGSVHAANRHEKNKVDKKTRERLVALAPHLIMGKALDYNISRAFILDDYEHNQERFEVTYLKLEQDERAAVDSEFYRRLESGLLHTDEATLSNYLNDLVMQDG